MGGGGKVNNFMLSISRSLQGHFGAKIRATVTSEAHMCSPVAKGLKKSKKEMTCGFLIQLVFCKKKNYVVYWC